MGRIQEFLSGFSEMTFQGKGAFWGICGALLLIILTYILSEGLREKLKKGAAALIVIPMLLLALFGWQFVNSCRYVPLTERTAEKPVSYTWEQVTKKTDTKLHYATDVKDSKTGKVYDQTYDFSEVLGQLTFKETSEHVYEECTVESTDGTSTITFLPDGTYRFTVKASGAGETGTYTQVNKALTLVSDASGAETKVSKTSNNLRYKPEVTDPETGAAYGQQEYKVKDLKSDMFVVEETLESVREEITVLNADETTSLTFLPDGTYRFAAADGNAEESGQYIFRNGELTMANASGDRAFWKNVRLNVGWIIFAVAVALAMILIFVFNAQIKAFMDKHPLIWLLIPAALLIYFVYVAIGWNIWVSVSDWGQNGDKLTPSYNWGGFGQYIGMFNDSTFWDAVWNTLKLFAIIPICLLLGIGLALLMDQGLRGTPVFRTLVLLPFALSFVVTGRIWQQMYNGSGGILSEFFKLFGIKSDVMWLNNEMVMYSLMIVMIWQFSGYVAVIFLAAIKNVPTNIINAAKLDGAYMPRIYWKMIIPQLKGAMGSCITILAMYALRSFDLIYSLTGLTNSASATLPIKMYVEAFSNDNFAYAAAISCFLLALVLVLILPLTYWTNRRKR